ncbi:hypothetical protein Tco_0646046 [Tanacetum coccineum]
MVAYLEKSIENADFAEIFWSTAKTKTVNNETRIHAKVEGKTIVISESSVRRHLQFDDEDGIACLTNTKIFENLQLMGYEKLYEKLTFYKPYFSPQWKYLIHTILQCLSSKLTAWNEFGTNIASAVICLDTNQKFNFSKLIFDGMIRNLDSSKKFLMYPRFLQLFLNKQIENLSEVNVVYDTPSHNKKIFTNMRRQEKDFSMTVTPLFSSMLAQQAAMGEGSGQPTDPQHTSTSVQPFNEEPITVPSSSQPKKTHRPRKAKRATEISQFSGHIPLVADEIVTKEREDRMEKAITTAFGLEAEQDSGNINRTQYMATLNEPCHQGTSSGSGLICQDTILGYAKAQTRFETVSKQSNDPPLSRLNTLGGGEDRLKLKEFMDLYTKLSDIVLDLETTKIAQAKKIANLKKRVKNLERKRKSRPPRMNLFKIGTSRRRSLGEANASKQGGNLKLGKQSLIFEDRDFDEEFDANMDEAIEQVYDANKDTVEEGEVQVPTADMEVNTASASVTTAGVSVSTTEPITTVIVNITTAEPSTPPTTTTTTVIKDEDLTISQTLMKMKSEKSKVRGMVMKEPSETATRPTIPPQQHDPKDKGKAQMQVELEEEERLAREREEDANIAEWDNAQAMMDADYKPAARIQKQEQEELTIKEKSRLFVELMDKRKKQFARLRAEEKRRKLLTKAQKRNQIFDEVQKAFDKTMSSIDSFVPVDSEVVKGSKDRAEGSETRAEGSSKRAGEDLQQESTKKQKMGDDKEKEELKQCFKIVLDDGDDVTIDATPFKMLKNFNREDLEALWRIVKARFKKIEPVNYMDIFLHINFKTMFEHHVEDNIWKNQQGLVKVLNWKLFDSCGVHCVIVQSIPYYLLVEKMYPLTKHTLHQMFNNVKLQVDYECEMAFDLLRLVKKQLKEGYIPE